MPSLPPSRAWELDALAADLQAAHERLKRAGMVGTAFHLEVALQHLAEEAPRAVGV